MKRIFLALLLILIIFVNSSKSIFAEENDNNIIDMLVEEAIKNNPELKTFEEKIQVFKEIPSQARSLDDPRLRLSILNLPVDTFRFNQEPMTQKQISIMQKFPFPGKLSLKGNMAEKELEIVREEYVDKKNNIIMQVEVIYQNLLFINKAIEITEENKNLLREFVKIAETKYTVGKGIQQDVLKAQVELSKMIDQLILLEQKRQTAVARLNTLLNRPTQMLFTDIGQIKQTSFNLTFENLQKIAEENRPVLIGLKHLIERYRFAYKLAEKDFYPDFDVGISYGQRDDNPTVERPDFFSGSITINIPLWYKTKESRKVAEEKAKVRKAKEQYGSMKNNISFQIKDIMAEIERYNQEIELFKTGLIPQSTLSLESAIAGYKTNKVDFITLVNNQITLYNYETDYYRALTNHEKKVAELEAAVGKRLF
jgi:outer membrane protein TolC